MERYRERVGGKETNKEGEEEVNGLFKSGEQPYPYDPCIDCTEKQGFLIFLHASYLIFFYQPAQLEGTEVRMNGKTTLQLKGGREYRNERKKRIGRDENTYMEEGKGRVEKDRLWIL